MLECRTGHIRVISGRLLNLYWTCSYPPLSGVLFVFVFLIESWSNIFPKKVLNARVMFCLLFWWLGTDRRTETMCVLRTYVNNMQIFDCVSSLNGPEYPQARGILSLMLELQISVNSKRLVRSWFLFHGPAMIMSRSWWYRLNRDDSNEI